ncbi:MAG: biotin--[acetyl-CoA-carboxylase] ligase [Clostridiales bacterium]|nr:biotin--[acetyl-CoA-carboxylase] ligase [Clostridiales bacterium]
MNQALLEALLPVGTQFRYLNVADSTNRVAKDWARDRAPHGACVIAGVQTAGRGRLGRSFYSPEGGLYMSVVLVTDADAGMLTTLAAVSVRRVVQHVLGIDLDIKWVNDLLLSGRKVCGILAEGVMEGGLRRAAVVGIGINVHGAGFPEELTAKAGTLLTAPPPDGTRERLAGGIVTELLNGLPQIPAHMDEYRAHCITLGKTVQYKLGNITAEGQAVGITDTGALLVATPTGTVTLDTGEAWVRMGDGGYL